MAMARSFQRLQFGKIACGLAVHALKGCTNALLCALAIVRA